MNPLNRRSFFALSSVFLAQCCCGWQKTVFAVPLADACPRVTFAVIADPHINVQGENGWKMGKISLACLVSVVAACNNEQGLDFVLVAGDLLNDGEQENLAAARKILATLHVPWFIIAGNHDYKPSDPDRCKADQSYIEINDFVRNFQGHGFDQSGRRYWACQVMPQLRVIGLDGCLEQQSDARGGTLPQEQIVWLDKQLADHPEDAHIVMLHHPLFSWENQLRPAWNNPYCLSNRGRVRTILQKYADRVALVVSGHRHAGLRLNSVEGILYAGMPSINSYPMRYGLFHLTATSLAWKTPAVAMKQDIHDIARAGLLAAPIVWQDLSRNPEAILSLYENKKQRCGRVALACKKKEHNGE